MLKRSNQIMCVLSWVAVISAIAAALFFLFSIFPVTGDDWFREGLGRSIHSLGDLAREVALRWNTNNSRILGNVLAYSAGSRDVLRELLRTAITLGLILLGAKCAGLFSLRGVLLTTACVLALPRAMFAQIYPWSAGFFNYVPPVMLLLACFVLMQRILEDTAAGESPWRAAAVFLLAFAAQLFIEHTTLCAICAGFVLPIWYRLWYKKQSTTLWAFCAGAILGGVLLFASPAYRGIAQTGGSYQSGLGAGLNGLLATARSNYPEIVRYLIADCPVLFFSLTLLCVLLYCRYLEKTALDLGLLVLLAGGCFCFAIDLGGDKLTACITIVWGLALGAACFRWMPKGAARGRALFFWAGAAVSAAPLLVVSPIGARCLYASYVFLLIVAGNLLSVLAPVATVRQAIVAAALTALTVGFYAGVYLPLYATENEQKARIVREMSAGNTEILLPAYEDKGYLWDAASAKIGFFYYYEVPGDIMFRFVPAAELTD